MKYDELKAEPMIINDDYTALYYEKESVDAAIAELKTKLESVQTKSGGVQMSEKGIHIHKFQDGNEAVVVEFGFGKIGIGIDDNCARTLAVHLQELNEAKDMGSFLTREEREENFKKPANPLEVILYFPDVKAIDNFIETLKIYRQKIFFPNVRMRHG